MTGANEPGQPAIAAWGDNVTIDIAVPSVALAIGAHPDDVEFGCGATLAKWAASGCIVHHLVCTDGSKGTWNVDADLTKLVERRRSEQRHAARMLAGERAGEVIFLGYVDGELDSHLAARARVTEAIRRLRPDVVLGHDPWKRYRLHPDHRHAGLLACDAVVAARDPHFFPEQGIAHHRPRALMLWEADQPNHVEDVNGWVGHKLAGLEAHESQFESTMHAVDADQLDAFRTRIVDRLASVGAPFALAAAEAFTLIIDL